MRKTIAFGLLILFMVSCVHDEPMFSGDLIFVEGSAGIRPESQSSMDQAIMGSTGAMVHVGIIEVCNDSLFVIDESGSVITSLSVEKSYTLNVVYIKK